MKQKLQSTVQGSLQGLQGSLQSARQGLQGLQGLHGSVRNSVRASVRASMQTPVHDRQGSLHEGVQAQPPQHMPLRQSIQLTQPPQALQLAQPPQRSASSPAARRGERESLRGERHGGGALRASSTMSVRYNAASTVSADGAPLRSSLGSEGGVSLVSSLGCPTAGVALAAATVRTSCFAPSY